MEPARLLCLWDSPGKNTGVGGHALLRGIFPTQRLNTGLLHCRQILYHLSHQGGLLLRDISKCKDRSTLKYQQIHMVLNAYNIYYLVLYRKSLLTPA